MSPSKWKHLRNQILRSIKDLRRCEIIDRATFISLKNRVHPQNAAELCSILWNEDELKLNEVENE